MKPTIEQMIRVDQAGEYGATCIYAGQLAVLKGTEAAKTLQQMAEQEAEHLKIFNRLVIEHEVRPTLLQPLWHITGYALGVVTALMGEKAVHTCTIAVEEVIEEHYENQLKVLPETEPNLKAAIKHCCAEEVEHKNMALEESEGMVAYPLLYNAIKVGSRVAIWLSTRV